MLIAGLTGGLASGKSAVAAEFGKLGCHVIEADLVGNEVMRPGTAVHDAILDAFGTVDRRALAGIVFSDTRELQRLSAIVHPAVRELSVQRFGESGRKIGIYVAAILVETGASRDFAKLIVVSCTRDRQIERAMQRPGASRKDVLRRLEAQLPLERKVAVADFVIDTNGAFGETVGQVRDVYDRLSI